MSRPPVGILLGAMVSLLAAQPPVSIAPPGPVVTVPGRRVTFSCLLVTPTPDTLLRVSWLLNGSMLVGTHDIIIEFAANIGKGIGSLTFTSLALEYNDTTIQCIGFLQSGQNYTSNGVHLLLQGNLEMLDSGVTFTTEIEVNSTEIAVLNTVASSTAMGPSQGEYATTPSFVTSATSESTANTITIIGAGVGVGVFTLLAVVLCGAILAVKCCRSRQPEIFTEKEIDTVIYEEIDDIQSSFRYTKNVLYGGLSTTGAACTVSRQSPGPLPDPLLETQKELVNREYQSLDDAYKIQMCSAYGVPEASCNRNGSCDSADVSSSDPGIQTHSDANKSDNDTSSSDPETPCACAKPITLPCDPVNDSDQGVD